MKLLAPTAAAFALCSGCGGDAVAAAPKQGLPIAFGLPRVVALQTYVSRGLLVEAVYQATALSGAGMMGRITNTGTLYANGTYSAQPTDRLVVVLGPQRHEFVVANAQGNTLSPTAAGWLMAPHQLQYTHTLEGLAEGQVTGGYDGQRFQVQVQGWQMQGDERYDVDLTAAGTVRQARDYHGQEVEMVYDLTGTIRSGDTRVDVSERHTSVLAAATNLRLRPSQRGSASRTTCVLENVLHAGGEEFRFRDVEVVTDVQGRGGTGSAGVVSASGSVLRNGERFGTIVLAGSGVVLDTGAGTIPLDLPLTP